MAFSTIFSNNLNQVITGFIGGAVFYILTLEDSKILGISLKNKLVRVIYVFLVALILTAIYSACVYFFNK